MGKSDRVRLKLASLLGNYIGVLRCLEPYTRPKGAAAAQVFWPADAHLGLRSACSVWRACRKASPSAMSSATRRPLQAGTVRESGSRHGVTTAGHMGVGVCATAAAARWSARCSGQQSMDEGIQRAPGNNQPPRFLCWCCRTSFAAPAALTWRSSVARPASPPAAALPAGCLPASAAEPAAASCPAV